MNIDKILKQMTIEEKAALVAGTNFMYTNPIPRLGIPSLCMADGPHGLRKQTDSMDNGVSASEPATSFPTAVTTASSFNPENTLMMGQAIGEECRHYGVHVLLGPGVNIKRNPLCGRNFEYFSEDPLLAGKMGAAEVEGVQSRQVGVSLKHFALNNSENYRFMGNSVASERCIREIYLRPFEYIVKKARPATLMCAYNQINGTYCSENKWLLSEVLRREWGFDGLVMTDWGAIRNRIWSLKAGLDLEMPGDTSYCRMQIIDGIASGRLPQKYLDQACRNVLKMVDRFVVEKEEKDESVDWKAHHTLAGDIAADSAVLLKNADVLPLNRDAKIAVMGDMFYHMRYQGAGSSMINPKHLTQPVEAFEERGISLVEKPDEADVILVFAGLTDDYESEGCDRETMKLPEDHLKMIDEAASYGKVHGKKVVVVLFGGSVVEVPFLDQIDGLLHMFLPGQNGGTAVAKLLFGEVNPSGKLSETWPMKYEDVPSHKTFGKGINEIYEEGSLIGYRYYNEKKIPVRFPFGYGLSYTSFEKSEWVEMDGIFRQTITNTGHRFGGEVAMLFLKGKLAGFKKVYLNPGECVEVAIDPGEDDQYFDKKYLEASDDFLRPEEPARYPITVESRFSDLKQTFMGRILYKSVMSVATKQMKEAKKLPEGSERDNKIKGALFLQRILDSNSLRTMSMCGGKSFPYNFARGFVEMANGHLITGALCFGDGSYRMKKRRAHFNFRGRTRKSTGFIGLGGSATLRQERKRRS